MGNQTAQILYEHERPRTNWKLPYFWWSKEILKSENLSLKIIMIDTQIMQNEEMGLLFLKNLEKKI